MALRLAGLGKIALAYRGSSDLDLLLAAMTVKPDAARTTLISNLIRDLKSAGVWDKLDLLYVPAAHDGQAALLNWKNPGAFTLIPTNAPTFTVDRGINGDGVASYYDTGALLTTLSKYSLNSAHAGLYLNTTTSDVGVTLGTVGVTSLRIRVRTPTATNLFQINSGSTLATPASAISGPQFAGLNRLGTDASYATNGGGYVTVTQASTSVAASNVAIGQGAGAFSSNRVSGVALGASLLQAEDAALYSALRTYMVAVGADA